jgi:hypothetical protein
VSPARARRIRRSFDRIRTGHGRHALSMPRLLLAPAAFILPTKPARRNFILRQNVYRYSARPTLGKILNVAAVVVMHDDFTRKYGSPGNFRNAVDKYTGRCYTLIE